MSNLTLIVDWRYFVEQIVQGSCFGILLIISSIRMITLIWSSKTRENNLYYSFVLPVWIVTFLMIIRSIDPFGVLNILPNTVIDFLKTTSGTVACCGGYMSGLLYLRAASPIILNKGIKIFKHLNFYIIIPCSILIVILETSFIVGVILDKQWLLGVYCVTVAFWVTFIYITYFFVCFKLLFYLHNGITQIKSINSIEYQKVKRGVIQTLSVASPGIIIIIHQIYTGFQKILDTKAKWYYPDPYNYEFLPGSVIWTYFIYCSIFLYLGWSNNTLDQFIDIYEKIIDFFYRKFLDKTEYDNNFQIELRTNTNIDNQPKKTSQLTDLPDIDIDNLYSE